MRQALRDHPLNRHWVHRRTTIKHILSLLIILFLSVGSDGSTLIFPLEQVKPGMKGKGKTVFLSNTIEEFDVEVLGLLEKVQPKKSIVLARLSGKGLEKTGAIQGMSGSPVYIDGKLLGAVAFMFSFSKEPIAGITPIGEMLAIAGQKVQIRPSQASPIPFRTALTVEDLLELNAALFSSRPSLFSQGQTLAPIGVPLIFSGFSSLAVEKARPLFTKLGFTPVVSGLAAQAQEKTLPLDLSLREGDAVAVQLVGGDLSVSAFGTVTYVDGNNVYAFGHPLYNLGPVDYAMAKANIVAVVPSLEVSFKMATTGARVGRFFQDRTSGALGEIGKMPKLIPLNIRLLESESAIKEFKLEIVNDRIFSPLLVNMVVSSVLSSEERSIGNLSLSVGGDLYLDNGASVHLEDLFSGNLDAAATTVSGLLTSVIYYLVNNEFEDVGIHRIDLNFRSSEEAKFASLERVWLDRYEASPGERIQAKIFYRTFGGQTFQEAVDIETPHLPAGSEFQLIIGDAASMHQLEMSQYRSQDFMPRNLGQLIRILNNLRKNNRIYFKMLASKPGLFLKGEELPNLPPSMKSMLASPRAASAPTELAKSTLREFQLPIPYVFKGMASIPVRIKK